jgi:tetratricopeptide (TPR) repeat protein
MKPILISALALGWLVIAPVMADETAQATMQRLQQRWAEVNYQLEGKVQETAFEELIQTANQAVAEHTDSAELWVWSGIIKSSYAGARGGLGALKQAKASRADLEKAMALDPTVLSGSAYTSLGALYYKVPGWPVGFGDEKKAEELLKKALSINPDGIDANYFYGDFLLEQKRYDEALAALEHARSAPARPDRPVADAGRQAEITADLESVRARLDH